MCVCRFTPQMEIVYQSVATFFVQTLIEGYNGEITWFLKTTTEIQYFTPAFDKMMKFVKTQENAPKFIVSIMPPIVHMFTMFTLCHTYTITPSHMYVMFACTYCSQVCSVHMYTMLACTQCLHVHMHRCNNNNTIRECFQTCTQCPHNCRMLKK